MQSLLFPQNLYGVAWSLWAGAGTFLLASGFLILIAWLPDTWPTSLVSSVTMPWPGKKPGEAGYG